MRPAAEQITGPVAGARGADHLYAVDLVRVLTFACVIAVHTVGAINPPGSIPAGGAAMLLHFTREAFVTLTAFVLVHRYRTSLHVVPFWRRRFLLIGAPYLIWSVIYTGLALSAAPLPLTGALTGALTQLGINLLTGTACYHLYFLVITMQCYLLFPLFLRLLRASAGHRGRPWWLLAISAVLQAGLDTGLHDAHPGGIAGQLLPYDGSFIGSYLFYLVLGGVAALHADQLQAWVRGHPAVVATALVVTGAAAEGWYLHSVSGGSTPVSASDVFQPVMLPWCAAVITALFTLGVAWAARRKAGLVSHAVEIGSDRSFGVFLVHPIVLWALTLGPSAWLSTHISALSSTAITIATTIVVSLLVVEIMRHSPLSMVLTGKRRPRRGSPVHPSNVFHLAIPARDLDDARRFYVEGIGCLLARRYADRITLNFFGDQVVCHLSDRIDAAPQLYPRHFGVTFREQQDWERLLTRAREHGLPFFADPFRRFDGQPEGHDAFVLRDPSNNLLEFKHYDNPTMMY